MRRIVLLSLLLTYIPLHSYAAPSDDALTVLNSLSVKGRAAKTGYTRAQFTHWSDLDRNGCDARNDTLKRDLTALVFKVGTASKRDTRAARAFMCVGCSVCAFFSQ